MEALATQEEAATLHGVQEMAGQVQAVVAQMEECMSCVVGVVTQRLESEIETAAAGTVTTSARNARAAIDGLREEVKAQMDQNRTDLE